jgi:hypothetical protein
MSFTRSIAVALALVAATIGPAIAQAGAASAPAAYRQLSWEELVPAGWDPAKEFREMNLGVMSDADPRAMDMLRRMREVWDKAPTNPALNGQAVRIPGYVVPLEETKGGMKEFLLVPYFGACIHTPPPPANQIVHVTSSRARKGMQSMDTVWVSGKLKAAPSDTVMGISGYRMEAVVIEPYVEKGR